jgi:hypothetical protein
VPRTSIEIHAKKKQLVAKMQQDRQPFWQYWRDLADYYLPQRYVYLQSQPELRMNRRNSMILDGTGTIAARVLASGMMNGITSPTRPWFKLRIVGYDAEQYPELAVWSDEVERRMMRVMAESNFYQSMAVMYLDLVIFGTACSLIYESPNSVIHCTNPALGEYYLMQSSEHRVNGLAREFTYKVHQLIEEFGLENCSLHVKNCAEKGGAAMLEDIKIVHLIEPNDSTKGYGSVGPQFPYRECYWEVSGEAGMLLRERGFFEFPAITPRWELAANDVYGTSPGMDALPDVIQIQHETKKKAQALDKLVSPPLLVDAMMEQKPLALLPNGVSYIPRLDATNGARPIYTVNPPLGEMTADIREVQARVREIFHNDLFQMISQLSTVRSATEIDARREEKLVLLGPVLERFENEALDPSIARIYGAMTRGGLLPELPPELADVDIQIQYVSILSSAQAAIGTAPIERLLQIIGSVAAVWPEATLIPNIPELLQDYALNIGVKQRNLRTRTEVAEIIAQQNEKSQQQEGMGQVQQGAETAKLLSETDVGGGANVLQRLLGNVV